MWATDELVEATLKMRSEEAERVRLISDARRRASEGGVPRVWHWRVEPGMEEAFEYLRGWVLPSQQATTVETAALAEGPAPLQEGARLGGPDQSLVPVGCPLPACCAPERGHRTRHTDPAVTGPAVLCCAP